MLVGDHDKRLAMGYLLEVGGGLEGSGGGWWWWPDFGSLWWWSECSKGGLCRRLGLWRDGAVGSGGSRTLVHSSGGRSAPKVVGAGWLATALRDVAVMINSDERRPIGFWVFMGKVYLCKERTQSTDSVCCPLGEKTYSDQYESAYLWTIFPPKWVRLFF